MSLAGSLKKLWKSLKSVFSDEPIDNSIKFCPANKTMTVGRAQQYMDEFDKQRDKIPFDYTPDCCYARARVMCDKIETDGYECRKFWYGGSPGMAELQ